MKFIGVSHHPLFFFDIPHSFPGLGIPTTIPAGIAALEYSVAFQSLFFYKNPYYKLKQSKQSRREKT